MSRVGSKEGRGQGVDRSCGIGLDRSTERKKHGSSARGPETRVWPAGRPERRKPDRPRPETLFLVRSRGSVASSLEPRLAPTQTREPAAQQVSRRYVYVYIAEFSPSADGALGVGRRPQTVRQCFRWPTPRHGGRAACMHRSLTAVLTSRGSPRTPAKGCGGGEEIKKQNAGGWFGDTRRGGANMELF